MSLRTLSSKINLTGKRVLVRVDWNVPLTGGMEPEASLKVERSIATLQMLKKRGAIVIVLTHLGRPKGRELKFSTQVLAPLLKKTYGLSLTFHGESVEQPASRSRLARLLVEAEPGSIHLLENVRFYSGEEKNSKSLAKFYAALGDLFINDAFASSHRAHVSVVGLARVLPSYAGPNLVAEIAAIQRLIQKPKQPFVAIIGGLKLSTKIPVLKSLLALCDRVLVGGAMANTFLVAAGYSVGASFVEKESLALAKRLMKNRRLLLPVDVVVTKKLTDHPTLRRVIISEIDSRDVIVDVGPRTLRAWAQEIQRAKTILWNGPVGIAEIKTCGAGSRFIARTVGARSRGPAFGVAGGGDTIPVIVQTKTVEWFDFVSTGGGALLEFLATKGKLPGLMPLIKK